MKSPLSKFWYRVGVFFTVSPFAKVEWVKGPTGKEFPRVYIPVICR